MADNAEPYDPKKDPKRRAKSKDPGWKYAYWPTDDKQIVECLLCGKVMCSGIKRAKQHLAGGFGDVLVCEKTTTEIMREMHAWMDKKRRKITRMMGTTPMIWSMMTMMCRILGVLGLGWLS
jgi:hypothetical protein